MELIIEQLARNGRATQRDYFQQTSITIGRAYDNDLVIDEPHVSPHHAELQWVQGEWQLHDLSSINGIQVHKGNLIPLTPLTEVTIGKQRLRFATADTAVADARPLGDEMGLPRRLGKPWVAISLLLLFSAWSVLEQYLRQIEEYEPVMFWDGLFSVIPTMLVLVGFWAVMGRLLKHEPKFFTHLGLWCTAALIVSIASPLFEWISYNLQTKLFTDYADSLLTFVVGLVLIHFTLRLATQLRNRTTWIAAATVCGLILVGDWVDSQRWQDEFSAYPDYNGIVQPPQLLLRQPQSETEVLLSISGLFDEATRIAEQQLANKKDD